MTKDLLFNINGNERGKFKKFLDGFIGEPRIAWYPSAGIDFRALLYLHPRYSEIHPGTQMEPPPPDLYLFTDYFPWKNSTFIDTRVIFSDERTIITIEHIQELPRLNLPLHPEIVHFTEGSDATDRAVFMMLHVESNQLGTFKAPVLYLFAENEAFYCHKLIPYNASISHIIHVRFGGGCGGGGNASGVWLMNVLKQLKCEVFITDGHYQLQSGDEFVFSFCSSIPRETSAKLVPIRIVESSGWSNHGDVSWNLVT